MQFIEKLNLQDKNLALLANFALALGLVIILTACSGGGERLSQTFNLKDWTSSVSGGGPE